MDTDRNLLFAVLALQADLLDRERFVQACALWSAQKDTPIADLLVRQGWLTPAHRAVVEQLLEVKLQKHGGDARASLADAAGPQARGALATVTDAEVEQSLAALPTAERPVDAKGYSTVPPADSAGRNILYEEIGHGGIGRVLRGCDPQLRRDLAVKVLRDEYRDDVNVRRRFVEEAQIGGQLQHPGLVPVYELGHFADRRPYFTMKLVKGRTLAELLKERPDPAHEQGRFLGIFEQVCQTLAYAHSKRVIHRDLKPANVMVGAFAEVQVLDWGLAKVLGNRDGDPDATTAGTLVRTARSGPTTEQDGRTGVVGTPAYMAPEQARGEVEAVDERADVFGLGAILCVLLTGQPPFLGGAPAEVLRQAAAGDVAESFARLDGCRADRELVELCRSCLSPRREDRPRDAGEVAARVAAHQEAVRKRLRAAELERAAAQARAAEERTRRRTQLALAAAVLALVVLGAGGGLLVQHQAAGRRADRARRDAEQRQQIEAGLDRAAGLRQLARWREAAAVLGQARQALGGAGPDDLRRRLDAADAELALVARLDAIRQRRATWVEGHFDEQTAARDYAAAFRDAGLGEVGDDEAAVAARVAGSVVAAPLVAALDDWATAAQGPRELEWLLAVARRADPHPWRDRVRDPTLWRDRRALRALADEALRDDGTNLREFSPQVLGLLGVVLGGGAEAVPLLRSAQRRYPDDFWLSLDLAHALRKAKQAQAALGYYEVAVALRPDAAAAHTNLGGALYAQKDLEGAIAAFRQAIALDPGLALAYSGLGGALRDKKRTDAAIAELHTAIRLDPGLALAHNNLGAALRDKKDLNGAIAEYRTAIVLDPGFAGAHTNLGNALAANHDLAGAAAEYRTAIRIEPDDARPYYNLGHVLSETEDLAGAVTAYRQALAIAPDFAEAHCNLGHALREQGHFAEALDELRRGDALGRPRPGWRYPSADWVRQAEQLVAQDHKLSAALGGQAAPAGPAERLELASFCQRHKRLHAAAVRLYADAFAADPRLAADLRQPHRVNAARCAALAAAGRADDAKNVPDKVCAMLRRQALAWLRDDLTACRKVAGRAEPAARQFVRQRLTPWQQDAGFAPVRNPVALGKLPEGEGKDWRQLWDDVAALLRKVQEKK